MISIDNAVELMMKTYLGLPQRVTGLRIPRNEYQDFSESFPKLLDALEKYAADKIVAINLGEIEWYHRICNELYHQGNGLTVEKDKIEIYSELAKVLFAVLFGFQLAEAEEDKAALLGEFMRAWVILERSLAENATTMSTIDHEKPVTASQIAEVLSTDGWIAVMDFVEINNLRQIRNQVVHGVANYKELLNSDLIKRVKLMTQKLEEAEGKVKEYIEVLNPQKPD